MLYKKVHRKYLRQFRIGRTFRYYGREDVLKITKLYTTRNCYISVSARCGCFPISLTLIHMTGPWNGKLLYIDDIEWLD